MSTSATKRDHFDVAIIGCGAAGSLAAIHLARAGFEVALFETKKLSAAQVGAGFGDEFSADFCTDFISYEALPLLREVGLDPIALGGLELTEMHLHATQTSARIKLPRRAIGLSRSRLEQALLKSARASGAVVRRDVEVSEFLEGLDETTGSILLSTSVGETRCQRLIVSSGAADFGRARAGRDSSCSVFKMPIRLKPSAASKLGAACEIFSFEGGYGGLTALGQGRATFWFVIDSARVRSIGTSWDALTSHIGKSNWSASHFLDGAVPEAREFSVTREMPIGYLRRAPTAAGVFYVGDQMSVLPPIANDQLAVDLLTSRRAVDALIESAGSATKSRFAFALEASRTYQRELRSGLRAQTESALALHVLFKSPRLVELTTYAVSMFPAIFNRSFRTTRCHLSPTAQTARLRSWSKPTVAPALR